MSNLNAKENTGCIAFAVLFICALILVPMALKYIGKEMSEMMKENPGGVFLTVLIIGGIAFLVLRETLREK